MEQLDESRHAQAEGVHPAGQSGRNHNSRHVHNRPHVSSGCPCVLVQMHAYYKTNPLFPPEIKLYRLSSYFLSLPSHPARRVEAVASVSEVLQEVLQQHGAGQPTPGAMQCIVHGVVS